MPPRNVSTALSSLSARPRHLSVSVRDTTSEITPSVSENTGFWLKFLAPSGVKISFSYTKRNDRLRGVDIQSSALALGFVFSGLTVDFSVR